MEKENPVYLGYIWKTPQFSLNLITKLALTSIIFAGFLVHYFWKSWHYIADMHKRYKITLYFYTFCFIVLFALNQSVFFFPNILYCMAFSSNFRCYADATLESPLILPTLILLSILMFWLQRGKEFSSTRVFLTNPWKWCLIRNL